jgi:riboflavin kinase/FMN adenylyltransferase
MQRERGPAIVRDDRSVLTTGTFDGVHLGHQAILRYLVARAADVGGVPTVVTFDPHPREVLAGQAVPLLTSLDERADLCAALGVERFVVLPFTRAMAQLEPEAYVADVLLGQVGMAEIVIGYDHRFGRAARGDRALLDALATAHGFSVDVIPAHVADGAPVSSSGIRRLLLDEGDAATAAAHLGRPFAVVGQVVRGRQRGRTLGFPTANVEPVEPRALVPRTGVYAVRARLPDGTRLGGMMNIGLRPTFETDGARSLEVHLLDYAGDLYGAELRVEVHARLRDERRFDGPEALVEQLREDRGQAVRALAGLP